MRNRRDLYLVYTELLMSNEQLGRKKNLVGNITWAKLLGLSTAIVICSYANNLVTHHLLSEDMP